MIGAEAIQQIADQHRIACRFRAGDRIFMAPLADVSVSGARIEAPRPGPVGSFVTVTLEHVGYTEARIVGGSDTMFVVEFAAADKTPDALIRKIFSGRCGQRSARSGSGWPPGCCDRIKSQARPHPRWEI